MNDQLRDLLESLRTGGLDMESALEQVQDLMGVATAATSEAHLDLDRQRRCGYPEVVFAQGKTTAALLEIFATLQAAGQDCLATRVSPDQGHALLQRLHTAEYNPVARTVSLLQRENRPTRGKVVVVTAGTSDRPVAEEAVETLKWMGCEVDLIVDVGVAGPHRLLEQRDRLNDCDAIVVVAGMEGALPSVVAGWVSCPVLAVPTSVGYGANFGGVSALLGMLNSCAANVSVVDIDAGFKGGYVAGVIAGRCHPAN